MSSPLSKSGRASPDCFSPQQLEAYAQGRTTGESANSIEKHLIHCKTCTDVVRAAPEDDFIAFVRSGGAAPFDKNAPSVVADDADLPVPLRDIAKEYDFFERVDGGGFGELFRGRHRELVKWRAIKWIPYGSDAGTAAAADDLARARREARAAAALNHPNVVQIFDARYTTSGYVLVMEWLDGCNVGTWAKRQGEVPIAAACRVIREAALGLQHAHDNGLIHRDIKPGNLFVTRDGLVKVIDFGIVKPAEPDAVWSSENRVCGTPAFMSPEQIRTPTSLDKRSDIYSLGCTFFELLAGRTPFRASCSFDMMQCHVESPAPSVRDFRPDVPLAIAALIDSMLAKDPNARPTSAAEVADRLSPYCDEPRMVDAPQPADDERLVPTEPMPRWPVLGGSRRATGWILGSVGVVAAVAVLIASGSFTRAPLSSAAQPGRTEASPKRAKEVLELIKEKQPSEPGRFVPLFNKRDLTGWKPVGNQTAVWEVEGSNLICKKGGYGNLMTERGDFKNFHLRVRARINSGGDSGIFFRAQQPVDGFTGFQAELKPGPKSSIGGRLGDLIRYRDNQVFTLDDDRRMPTTWFLLEVIATEQKIQVLLDGKLTSELVDDLPASAGHIFINHAHAKTEVAFEVIEISEEK